MTSNTPTPARPALDEGDEPTPEAILIAAWKLRFNKAFRPEEEAGALMAFLDTVGLCVVSKRALADMRGALQECASGYIFATGNLESGKIEKASYDDVLKEFNRRQAIAVEALARSAP